MDRIYLFDICGTVYFSNTTYDFLKYFFRKHNKFKYLICKVMLSLPFVGLYVFGSKIGFKYDLRRKLISLLKGEESLLTMTESKRFVTEFLSEKKSPSVYQMLKESLLDSNDVYLVSASIDPVVSAIAEHLKVDKYFSTILEKDAKGKFTGKITQDLKGKKLEFLNNSNFDFSIKPIVITDNFDDLPLIFKSDKAVIVSKNKNVKNWKKGMENHKNWSFIHV